MVRLKLWQWVVLALPVVVIITFLLVAAGTQISEWGINWIWGVVTLMLVGWRSLLVRWTRSQIDEVEAAIASMNEKIELINEETKQKLGADDATKKAEAALQKILQTKSDRPIWDDWQNFWQQCQEMVVAVAHIYHPEVKYPLLNIYVPQAYGLIRGTVDDMDRWMQQLSPVLNQVTVGQAYQAYEIYRKLEPSARKLMQAWGWVQWLVNPAAAAARVASQKYSEQANQQLLANLSLMVREAALRNLCRQAIALYGGNQLTGETLGETLAGSTHSLPKAKTQTLQEILAAADPPEKVEQKPVNILLVGRTGAGKSSLINTIFQAELAAVDLLPNTDRIQSYYWQTGTGETLTLWDSPGYEQVNKSEFRDQVLEYANNADLLLLVTPALDPALQMDVDFLKEIKGQVQDLPAIAIVSQVDRLRPIREWQPPYDWVWGDRPKEKSIREATEYRREMLGEFCDRVLPLVSFDPKGDRQGWNIDNLSLSLIEAIAPVKQLRLARFLRDLETRTVAAAKIIDRYTFQMSTAQGLTALLKSPVLQFISTLTTGNPTLAYILADKIPVEQLPVVIGKLQMAYDLFTLLSTDNNQVNFELLVIWPLLLENTGYPDRNAWAFGHALVEYWTKKLTVDELRDRVEYYLQQEGAVLAKT
jgi:predicted GTPase